jgi:hypothetical protein
MTGVGEWATSFNKAREMVSQMTLEEKVCGFITYLPLATCAY